MTQLTFEIQSANLIGEHAKHVDDVRQLIIGQITSLISDLEPMATEWQGGAGGAFQQLKAEYEDRHAGIDRVLMNIAIGLSQNQSDYSNADTQGTDGLATIKAQTSGIQAKMNPNI